MNLYDTAVDECRKGGTIEDIAARVAKRIDDDARTEAVARGIASAIYEARGKAKSGIKRSVNAPAVSRRSVGDASEAAASALLERWSMRDGRALGDWTGEELASEVQVARAQASGQMRLAAFYEALAKKAGSRTVRECVSSMDAERLWTNVSKTISAVA